MSPQKQSLIKNITPVQIKVSLHPNVKTKTGIAYTPGEGLKINTLATLESIAENTFVRRHFAIISEAIRPAASPQIRNFATLGENLAQNSRCWYYRRKFNCWFKGGNLCFAKEGKNARHALFGSGPCFAVHPSDTASALIVLGAEISICGPGGEYILPLGKFFRLPREGHRKLTVLGDDEFITEVFVPAVPANSKGTYIKAMDRQVRAFALAGLAAQVTFDSDYITDAALVLSGVAPIPWRLPDVEMLLMGNKLNDKIIASAAGLAVTGALPLAHNGYKVGLVKGLVTEALNSLKP